jgi:hypothetical protein
MGLVEDRGIGPDRFLAMAGRIKKFVGNLFTIPILPQIMIAPNKLDRGALWRPLSPKIWARA